MLALQRYSGDRGIQTGAQAIASSLNVPINEKLAATHAPDNGSAQLHTSVDDDNMATISEFGSQDADFVASAARAVDVFQRDMNPGDSRFQPRKKTAYPVCK
jgi:hypothetical protein